MNQLLYKLLIIFNYPEIIGGLLGFIYFIIYLESRKMGGIWYRNGKFTPYNVIMYMKSPFYNYFLWHPILLRANWIFMTSLGIVTGKFLQFLILEILHYE